jgi:hypothetical protein
VQGGIQLGPFGTAATHMPIVPAPGDYDDGETGGIMIGRENRSTRRKPAPMSLCSPQIPHSARKRTRNRRGGEPATNRLSYGTALTEMGTTKPPGGKGWSARKAEFTAICEPIV